MLMGSKYIILVMFYLSLSPFVQGFAMDSYNPHSLDAFINEYAHKTLIKPQTGTLYNISLPANFSGMEISILRVRSGSFWARGANFSFFHIPPRILPMPFLQRLDIVYQNLGNWSSYYYNVPNYTLITPVVGLMTYGAMNSSGFNNTTLNLTITGDPIMVRFPHNSLPVDQNMTMKCVRFDQNGSVEFSNVTMPNVCITRVQGHFSIVIPSRAPSKKNKKKEMLWKWWVIGFSVGVGGLVLLGLFGILIYKIFRVKRIEKMQRQSDRSEALVTTWIGRSKMPSATGIRTQPVLENEYIP